MDKLKVVWICHFSNQDIRDRLPLSQMRVFNFFKNVIGSERKKYKDFAPWINNLINEFENFDDIELHVISPHKGLIPFSHEFERRRIHYHFFKPELPFMLSTIGNSIFRNMNKSYFLNRLLVKKLIRKIKPDLINLIGTENPYYSITSLDIKNIPVYISAQTVYTNPLRKIHSGNCNKLNWDVELRIHQKEKYFGCTGRMHRDLILHNNPDAIIFKMFFPLQKPSQVKEVPKEFNFVFFAADVTPKKGIEDALDALAVVKKEKRNVTLNVVGKCAPDYFQILQCKINELNLKENVSFNEYFPVHADMHQHVKKSKFALLPIKLDVISGSVIESMLLELPVVTYKTSGTPYLNKDGETVLLADIGDIHNLADNMLKLLNNPDLAEKLKKVAKNFVEKEFDNTTSAKRLVINYRAVIDHYYKNKPIHEGLLFNSDEFPLY